MAPTSPKAAAAASASSLLLPPTLQAVLSTLSEALDGRAAIDAAIARNAEALTLAEAEQPQAFARISEIDVQLAIETDATRSEGLEDAAADARGALDEVERKVARLTRIHKALFDKAAEADAAIAAARRDLETEKQAFGRACCIAIDAEMCAVLTTLAPVLARMYALRELQIVAWQHAVLQDIAIPGADYASGSLLQAARMRVPSGEIVDLATRWREFADQATLNLADGDLAGMRFRTAAYRPFVRPSKASAPPAPNPQNVLAAEANREADQREEARAAASGAKPGWSGQSWRGNVP